MRFFNLVKLSVVSIFLLLQPISAVDVNVGDLDTYAKTVRTEKDKFCSLLLVYNEKGEVLGVSRKNAPELVGLPGGKCELGDNFKDACIRETKEETGIDVSDFSLTPIFAAKDGPFTVLTFVSVGGFMYSSVPLAPGKGEGKVEWVPQSVISEGAFPKYNIGLFKSILRGDRIYLGTFFEREANIVTDEELKELDDNALRELVKRRHRGE